MSRTKRRKASGICCGVGRLLPHKARIETELFARLRDLFALEVDLVFYDLTSTYFEGAGPPDFAVHGYSRDGKPRNRQVLVGLVMINGWPIAHRVFRATATMTRRWARCSAIWSAASASGALSSSATGGW
jgi:hypothetical protein